MNTAAQRLRWARQKAGFKTAADAVRAFGWTKTTYADHENGHRNPSRTAAIRYGSAYKVPWAWILEGGHLPDSALPVPRPQTIVAAGVPVRGEVAAGRWLDIDADVDPADYAQHPIAAHPGYPFEAQYGLIVRGTSMNKLAAPGDVLHCVDVGIAGVTPAYNDVVVVVRRRLQQGQREVTAKRILQTGRIMVLAPDSTDPKWKPIKFDTENPPEDEEIAVIALVIGSYRPFRKPA